MLLARPSDATAGASGAHVLMYAPLRFSAITPADSRQRIRARLGQGVILGRSEAQTRESREGKRWSPIRPEMVGSSPTMTAGGTAFSRYRALDETASDRPAASRRR